MKYDTKNSYGKRMVKEAKIAEIGKDPYTAGTGIEIEDGVLSIDTSTVALKTDIPTVTPVEANTGATTTATLTDLQVGTVTYEVPQGGSGNYLHNVRIAVLSAGTSLYFTDLYESTVGTAYTSVADYLTAAGYTITSTTDTMSKYIATNISGTYYALAYREGYGVYQASFSVDSSGNITLTSSWGLIENTATITDTVISL